MPIVALPLPGSLRRFHAILFFCLVAILGSTASAAQNSSARVQTNLDRGWKFLLGDQSAAKETGFKDAAWDDVNLPHSFSIPYFRSPHFYVGYGWYRRHLHVDAAPGERQFFLEFEGVFQEAEVFVNGEDVGRHQGGYTGFSLDITRALHAGDNLIAVRVNNKWNAQLNPRAGEHVFSGGIYRNVFLVSVSPVHVTWYGTFVTTPEVSPAAATVHIETEVRNARTEPVLAQVQTEIVDPDGRSVARLESEKTIAPGATETVPQTSSQLANPRLWHPDHPSLYTAVSRIYVHGKLEDEYTTTFGIRSIQWTPDRGFLLNGERYYFHGADVHQDHAGWGDAVTSSAITRDVQMVKDAGFDFIRGSHYPHSPVFADACDRLGVLFWSENSFWGTAGPKVEGGWTASAFPPREADRKPFEESVKRSLAEMIRINRNHPSIVAWSMTNEVFFSDANLFPEMRAFLSDLVQYTHALDPTRPAALGGVQRGDLDRIGDVAGYNGDGARLFLNPGVPSAVTEYGSAKEQRPGSYDPHWDELQQTEFPWRSGQALWCAFDHGSIFGGEGMMGIVDYFRIPKRSWYWYRNAYKHIPPPAWPMPGTAKELRLSTVGGTKIEQADGSGSLLLMVTVLDANHLQISNSPAVTLTIESGPGEFPTGRSITFRHDTDIDIRDGQAAIEFRSYYGGKTVIRASSPGLRDNRITLESAGAPAYVEGVTPLFHPPAYVHIADAESPDDLQELANDRPTLASSEAAGHSGPSANDGDRSTFWSAATRPGATAWWGVDLERSCNLKNFSLVLPVAGNFRLAIQASDEAGSWKTVVEKQDIFAAGERKDVELPQGTAGRFLRVVFEALPADVTPSISEFTLEGTVRK
jgi:hypothetical protein